MSSIESIVDAFIEENELDVCIKPALQGLVNKCFEGVFKHVYGVPIPETGAGSKAKAQKVLKSDKIEDPSVCQTRDELHCCTTVSLSAFCKKNNLKVGGNKTDVIDRVWRFLQGTTSADDQSPRKAAKATKKVAEKHPCSGCNAKGEKCAVAGSDCYQGTDYWFCWRHIVEAAEFVAKLEDPNQPKPKERAPKKPKAPKASEAEPKAKAKAKKVPEPDSESDSDTEPEPKPKAKVKSKAKAKKAELESESDSDSEPEPKPVKKSKAKAKKVPEPESESEDVSDQDSEDERVAYYEKLAQAQLEKELEALA
jgi:hypothetical protein